MPIKEHDQTPDDKPAMWHEAYKKFASVIIPRYRLTTTEVSHIVNLIDKVVTTYVVRLTKYDRQSSYLFQYAQLHYFLRVIDFLTDEYNRFDDLYTMYIYNWVIERSALHTRMFEGDSVLDDELYGNLYRYIVSNIQPKPIKF